MSNPLLQQFGLHLGPFARISGPNGDRWLNPHELVKAERQIMHGKFKDTVGAAAFRANRLATRIWIDAAQSVDAPSKMPELIHLHDHDILGTVTEALDLGVPDSSIQSRKTESPATDRPSASGTAISVRMHRLGRLAQLRESKTISVEEFDDLKQAILQQPV